MARKEMKKDQINDTFSARAEVLRARTKEHGRFKEIMLASGGSISIAWLKSFVNGTIKSPGVQILDRLAEVLEKPE